MSWTTFARFVEGLPPGRARTKQERLARSLGEAWIVRVAYSDEPLWLVTGLPQAQALAARGTPRGSIWTLAELQGFLEACGSPVPSLEEAAGLLVSACHTAREGLAIAAKPQAG